MNRILGKILVLTAVLAAGLALAASPALALSHTLTVQKVGSGYVTGAGGGIDCGADCSQAIAESCAYNPAAIYTRRSRGCSSVG